MNKLYTREDIIREVARRAEFTIKDTKDIFVEFEKLVREIVAEDSELKYRGMFDIKGTTIKPHMGYDVNTKERKMLEGKKRLVITPGDALRKIYKESGIDASDEDDWEESETTETGDLPLG